MADRAQELQIELAGLLAEHEPTLTVDEQLARSVGEFLTRGSPPL